MNIYLVRHGLARSNLKDPDACGYDPVFESVEKHDPSLTPQGERQADLTGIRLAGVAFDAAFVSPLHRALSTCAGILRHQKKHIGMEVLPALSECNSVHHRLMPEALLGHIWPDIQLIMPYDLPEDTPHNLWLRANRVVEYMKSRFRGEENILIVSHGAFLSRYLNAAFLSLSETQAGAYILAAENCSITKLRIAENERTTVCAIDETGHLGDAVSREPFDVIE